MSGECVVSSKLNVSSTVSTANTGVARLLFEPNMDEWELSFGELLDKELTLHQAKRADYTGGGDPLHNYRKSAELIGISADKLILSRMMEKLIRLSTLLGSEAVVKDESFEDTALDIAIQAKLLILARRPRWQK